MAKYRKKPVVIEAHKWSERNNNPPDWLTEAIKGKSTAMFVPGEISQDPLRDDVWYVRTLEGEHIISEDDWIIRGVAGELYPCKPDIFEQTYENARTEIPNQIGIVAYALALITNCSEDFWFEKAKAWSAEGKTAREILNTFKAGDIPESCVCEPSALIQRLADRLRNQKPPVVES